MPGAVGYNVLWGIAKDKLYQTYQVFADQGDTLELRALTAGPGYYQLEGRNGATVAMPAVARRAGATDLVEGALHRGSGGLRLDLRRLDLQSGAVRHTAVVEGGDPFALVDSATAQLATRYPAEPDGPYFLARRTTWMLTHQATALAVVRDTAGLRRIADSLVVLGPQSAYGRDHRLHHHVRGLLWRLRGRSADAAERGGCRALTRPAPEATKPASAMRRRASMWRLATAYSPMPSQA